MPYAFTGDGTLVFDGVVTYGGSAGTSSATVTFTTTTSSTTMSIPTYGHGYSTSSTSPWVHFGYVADPQPELSEEGLAQQQRTALWLTAERNWRTTEQARVRDAADAKAAALLLAVLPEDQKEPYRLTGVFEVIGSAGGRYRIRRGVSGNIDWLDAEGKVGGSLCCHPPTWGEYWVPTSDVMLAQMLALRTDEADFLRVANVSAGRRPPALAHG